jgi:hypothetical protein
MGGGTRKDTYLSGMENSAILRPDFAVAARSTVSHAGLLDLSGSLVTLAVSLLGYERDLAR